MITIPVDGGHGSTTKLPKHYRQNGEFLVNTSGVQCGDRAFMSRKSS